jgi:SAM-dependent methyltransferase
MYRYDERFFEYANRVSARSADAVVPILVDALRPASVLDVGCARGVWLRKWQEAGVADVVGVDGDYIRQEDLWIPSRCFVAGDLAEPIELGRRFDLVQSLEVAEHLTESRARSFVADLCRHADFVLFGAAPPGQGGENHINEQPYSYWQALFDAEGYDAYDYVRPRVLKRKEVTAWHRYNPVLYVNRTIARSLSESVRASQVQAGRPVPDLSPPLYRMRKAFVRCLPSWATQALASVQKRTMAPYSL